MFRKAVAVLGILEVLAGAALLIGILVQGTEMTDPDTLKLEQLPTWLKVSGPAALVVGGLIAYILAHFSIRRNRRVQQQAGKPAS